VDVNCDGRSLDYARPALSRKTLALPAMISGLISGPMACGLALIAAYSHLPEKTKEVLGLLAWFVPLGGAFGFSMFVRLGLPESAHPSDRKRAAIGTVAPFIWIMAIFAFIVFAVLVWGLED
jgi:hypothetical protein